MPTLATTLFALTSLALGSPINQGGRQSSNELLSNGDFSAGLAGWSSEGSNKPTPTLEARGPNGSGASVTLRYKLTDAQNAWDTQFGQGVSKQVGKGDVISVSLWLKAEPKGQATLIYELAEAPHTKALQEDVFPDKVWREYRIAFKTDRAYDPGKSQFKLFLTGKSGNISIAQVKVENLGPTGDLSRLPPFLGSPSYERQTQEIAAAKKRIAALRRAPATITVFNAAGKPVPNATVKLTQTTHEFRFGTAVVPSLILDKGPNGQRYREVLKRCFNTATFENQLKWRMESPTIFPNEVLPASDWLAKNGIRLRGHTLVWGSRQNLPDGLMDLPVEQARQKVREHVKDYASKMKGRVYLWDVVNEAVTEQELWQKLGWDELTNTYRLARQIDPRAKLCYNDYNICSDAGNGRHRARAIEIAANLKKSGDLVDIFGDQAHMGFPGTPPARLNQIWDEVATKTGLPIEITEFDFTSRDDTLHAQYVEDFLTTAFAHPKMQGIILWGFWENAHWLANRKGHFVNADWTWRPGMKALDRLINKEWKTNVTLKTNAKGEVVVPAFYGDYKVEVLTPKTKVTITGKHLKGTPLKARVKVVR